MKRWAIVALMGHSRIAGEVENIEAGNRLRVHVPAVRDEPAFEVEYGPSAVFEVRYVDQDAALRAAHELRAGALPYCARQPIGEPWRAPTGEVFEDELPF